MEHTTVLETVSVFDTFASGTYEKSYWEQWECFLKFRLKTINGNGITPCFKFFRKHIGKFYAYDFLAMSLKFYLLTFKKNQGSSFPRELALDLFSTGGKRKFAVFEVSSSLRQTQKICL